MVTMLLFSIAVAACAFSQHNINQKFAVSVGMDTNVSMGTCALGDDVLGNPMVVWNDGW